MNLSRTRLAQVVDQARFELVAINNLSPMLSDPQRKLMYPIADYPPVSVHHGCATQYRFHEA